MKQLTIRGKVLSPRRVFDEEVIPSDHNAKFHIPHRVLGDSEAIASHSSSRLNNGLPRQRTELLVRVLQTSQLTRHAHGQPAEDTAYYVALVHVLGGGARRRFAVVDYGVVAVAVADESEAPAA